MCKAARRGEAAACHRAALHELSSVHGRHLFASSASGKVTRRGLAGGRFEPAGDPGRLLSTLPADTPTM
jgi:hypothetical protein